MEKYKHLDFQTVINSPPKSISAIFWTQWVCGYGMGRPSMTGIWYPAYMKTAMYVWRKSAKPGVTYCGSSSRTNTTVSQKTHTVWNHTNIRNWICLRINNYDTRKKLSEKWQLFSSIRAAAGYLFYIRVLFAIRKTIHIVTDKTNTFQELNLTDSFYLGK